MESTALITQEALDALSYRSAFGKSLKQISLQKLPLEAILEDVAQYRQRYIDALIAEGLAGSRFKSDDSIWRKYEKTLRAGAASGSAATISWGSACIWRRIQTNFPTISGW